MFFPSHRSLVYIIKKRIQVSHPPPECNLKAQGSDHDARVVDHKNSPKGVVREMRGWFYMFTLRSF